MDTISDKAQDNLHPINDDEAAAESATTAESIAIADAVAIAADIAAAAAEPAAAEPAAAEPAAALFAEIYGEESVSRLDYKGKELILIPTAHVSKQSAELVKKIIAEENPDSVCIELDDDRYQEMQNPQKWKNTDIAQVIKSKKVGFMFASLILSSYQKKLAEKLDTNVGQEMLQGMASAKEVGAELVLADRKIQVTFMRIWRSLGFIEKMRMAFNLIFSFDEDDELTDDDIQKMLKEDMLEAAIGDIREKFPKVGKVLIDERDQYLANKIKNAPGNKVVAILGGAHLAGVKEEIYKEQNLDEISVVPPSSPFSKIAGWLIPVAIVALIVVGFVQGVSVGLDQIKTWFLYTSTLAGIFTLLALGHPLTILTSVVVAPFTTLHPFFACGWFSGLAEAYLRKPTVEDIEKVPTDIFSFKGFFKNRFLRIIMIVFMANIGASIGTITAGMDIIKSIF
ncbi:MAG: TraB/GumN family protein [Clostridiales Family XIII bacterium]|jgi:pheromone shutdown-related protein TraB|nr:TraB/GumN family protein [Clostridiales Family XIII bacterium]